MAPAHALRILALLLVTFWCASSAEPTSRSTLIGEFVGTTPGAAPLREFVGGLDTNAPCHCITWHLTLSSVITADKPAKFTLITTYGLPGRNDPNQIEDGPIVKVAGTWTAVPSSKPGSKAVVYRLLGKDGRALRLVRLHEHLLHFSDPADQLMVGNAGWSYTLNRKGVGHEN